jgi:hypothetical protein
MMNMIVRKKWKFPIFCIKFRVIEKNMIMGSGYTYKYFIFKVFESSSIPFGGCDVVDQSLIN